MTCGCPQLTQTLGTGQAKTGGQRGSLAQEGSIATADRWLGQGPRGGTDPCSNITEHGSLAGPMSTTHSDKTRGQKRKRKQQRGPLLRARPRT